MRFDEKYSVKLRISALFQCSRSRTHVHTFIHTHTFIHSGTEAAKCAQFKVRMCGCRADTDLITSFFVVVVVVIFPGYFLLYYFEYFFSIKNKNAEALNVHVVSMCTARVCLLVRACCCKLSNGVPSSWQWTEEREVSPFPCGHAA